MSGVRKAFGAVLKSVAIRFLLLMAFIFILWIIFANMQTEMAQLAGFGLLLKLALCITAVFLMKWVNVAFQEMRGRDRKTFIEKIQEDAIATAIYIAGNSLAAALVFGLILSG